MLLTSVEVPWGEKMGVTKQNADALLHDGFIISI